MGKDMDWRRGRRAETDIVVFARLEDTGLDLEECSAKTFKPNPCIQETMGKESHQRVLDNSQMLPTLVRR